MPDLLRDTKKMMVDEERMNNISYPARNPIIFLTGAEYGYSLKSKGVDIKTLFASHVASDASYHCSQTWTRVMNLLMCQIFDDWDLQFISLPIETEFGNYFDKDVYFYYMNKYNLPIEKTRTCVKRFDKQCGDCPACWDRRVLIKKAGLEDKTEYLYEFTDVHPTYYTHDEEEKDKPNNQ
jgi:7-cyano-7-deazaguanine synthase in queuosine biosynthesis